MYVLYFYLFFNTLYILIVAYQTCFLENGISHQLKSLGFYFQAEDEMDVQ